MRRREFIALVGCAAATWPLAARAKDRLLGVLMSTTEDNAEGQANFTALRQGLQEFGWTEDQNIRIDCRWGGGDVERTSAYAAALVGLSPDVILAYANAQLAPLSRETQTIPIVFVGASDPVRAGYVASFARPGGNITGFTLFEPSMAGKWLGVLKEIAPSIARVALMVNPDTATLQGAFYWDEFETAATMYSIKPTAVKVRTTGDIEAELSALGQQPDSGLIVAPDTFTISHSELIVRLAERHRVPAAYSQRHFSVSGGLISYGPDTIDTFRRSASYVDRILRGEKPADLPIQAPTKFQLVINLKTAKALGLTVSDKLLATADEVIE
jgi:putative tryptophan/tyrosine transport system substrate-binding protein